MDAPIDGIYSHLIEFAATEIGAADEVPEVGPGEETLVDALSSFAG